MYYFEYIIKHLPTQLRFIVVRLPDVSGSASGSRGLTAIE